MSTIPSQPLPDTSESNTRFRTDGYYLGGVFHPYVTAPDVRALHIAMVQLTRRNERDPDYVPNDDPMPEDPAAFRLHMASRIANFLGAWKECTSAACMRSKRCRGTPPRCFAHLPEPSRDEIAFAQAAIQKAIAQRPEMEE
jgi:hypothetical protein